MTSSDGPRQRKPRADGQRSRHVILQAAARLASAEGLGGLSIGALAAGLGMSKSGLYAHFGSKEDLETAVVEHATRVFRAEVLDPAESAPPGVARLVAHCEGYLSYLERRVFPGGCFFQTVATEVDSQTGPVREAVAAFLDEVDARRAGYVRDAQARGELPAGIDVHQLAFEIGAMLAAANAGMLMRRSTEPLHRARAAIERTLTGAATA